MVESTLWHPVALAGDVANTPLAVQLLDQPLVLWRDGLGGVQALADRCPHRGARLSLGRVTAQGQLECPYHGWQFDGAGRCQLVPALPDFVPPAGHRLKTVAVREAHGLLWVRLDGEGGDLPAFAAESDERLRKLNCGPYDVAASAPRIVENFLDMAHFGTVHEDWLGDREHMAVPPYQVQATPTGPARVAQGGPGTG